MKIINLPENREITFYVIERYFKKAWRLIYLQKFMFSEEGRSAFDLVWDDLKYSDFSTAGECYRLTGIPGSFDEKSAISAFKEIKDELGAKGRAPIRLRKVTMVLKEEVILQTRQLPPNARAERRKAEYPNP